MYVMVEKKNGTLLGIDDVSRITEAYDTGLKEITMNFQIKIEGHKQIPNKDIRKITITI